MARKKSKPLFAKGTRIFVTAFEPGDGVAAVGGFDWFPTATDAVNALLEHLKDEVKCEFDHTLLIRRVTLPRSFETRNEVTQWLDGTDVLTTKLEELPGAVN